MSNNPKSPSTVEEMVEAINHIFTKYPKGKLVPFEDSVMPTHEFFLDLCQGLIAIEKAVRGE